MGNSNRTLNNLLEKLLITEEIYDKASSTVHNTSMTVQFEKTARKREKFVNGMCDHLGINLKDFHIGFVRQVKAQIDKLTLEFDNAMLQRNEYAVLSLCIKYDEMLVDDYQELLNDKTYEHNVHEIALFQHNDIKHNLQNLIKKKKAYDFEQVDA